MLVLKKPDQMRAFSEEQRAQGRTIGFVPTMGYFHEGHLALMRQAKDLADLVVISIFVNPTQFGPSEDLAAYPRDFERDSQMAEQVGVDVIFNPEPADIYPEGFQTTVLVNELIKPLCGVNRPVHFKGVATVCCKLFNIVRPHLAVFGEKDYQQLLVVDRVVRDLNMDLEIVPGPTFREPDGLAMSSRNVYLTPEQRKQAPALIRALRHAQEMVEQGVVERDRILSEATAIIQEQSEAQIDYVELRTIPDLHVASEMPKGRHLLALAVRFGKARLIDNTVLPFPE